MDWEAAFSLPAAARHQALLRNLRRRTCPASPQIDHPSLSSLDRVKGCAAPHMAPKASLNATIRKTRDLAQNVAAEAPQSALRTCRADIDPCDDSDAEMSFPGDARALDASDMQTTVASQLCRSRRRKLNRKRSPIAAECGSENDERMNGAGCSTTGVAAQCKGSKKKRPGYQLRMSTKVQMETKSIPASLNRPALELGTEDGKLGALLSADFFKCDALDLGPRLLGKFLRRDDVVLQITEVEAYRPNDSACHGRFGITARTAPVFGPGGHAYVYLCYGLHIMLNIVADLEGVGAAVLIRSCAPVGGIKTIQSRRGHTSDKPMLLTGPGKVGQALGLTTEWSNHALYTPGGLEVLDGPAPESILVGPRVGIDYASPEDTAALWRFAIAGTPWISAPHNTLRRP